MEKKIALLKAELSQAKAHKVPAKVCVCVPVFVDDHYLMADSTGI